MVEHRLLESLSAGIEGASEGALEGLGAAAAPATIRGNIAIMEGRMKNALCILEHGMHDGYDDFEALGDEVARVREGGSEFLPARTGLSMLQCALLGVMAQSSVYMSVQQAALHIDKNSTQMPEGMTAHRDPGAPQGQIAHTIVPAIRQAISLRCDQDVGTYYFGDALHCAGPERGDGTWIRIIVPPTTREGQHIRFANGAPVQRLRGGMPPAGRRKRTHVATVKRN